MEHTVLMYSTAYNLWTFNMICTLRTPFYAERDWKKFIPRDSFNSSLYILFSMAINYTESVVHICLLYVDSGLTYIISLLVNSWKCTTQLTEHTGRELSTPLVTCVTWNDRLFTFKTVSSKQMIENIHFPPILEIKILCTSKVFNN